MKNQTAYRKRKSAAAGMNDVMASASSAKNNISIKMKISFRAIIIDNQNNKNIGGIIVAARIARRAHAHQASAAMKNKIGGKTSNNSSEK